MQRYLEALRVKGFSERTVITRASSLRVFLAWCYRRELKKPTIITRPHLLDYQRHLFFYRQRSGLPLSVSTQLDRLSAIRIFFRWLTRENVILSNPASELELPKKKRRVPREILTPAEAEAVLSQPDLTDPLGLRDRAVLELFYSTGIRRMELSTLLVLDLDWHRGTLLVRNGKGGRDRVVPVGERALAWVDLYLREVRPELVAVKDEGYLFLTNEGENILGGRLGQMVKRYVNQADLGKTGSCHMFRHAAATAMLENGADIRFIQELLGHVELGTTQIYTRVSIRKLKEIHTATHPSARLPRPGLDPRSQPEPESQETGESAPVNEDPETAS